MPEHINIDFYDYERKDTYTIGSTIDKARASHLVDGTVLRMFINNIWRDTQNFEDFVEALNIIYLTEILCMNYKKGEKVFMSLCSSNGKTNNNCLFLLGAKKALDSNYTLYKND